ncbi:MAG: alpha/beta hydrolase [Cyclobacteriaceae bacterium]|nr:alpha/beta hydrolase [Cyclobacteriaceae bacterium]
MIRVKEINNLILLFVHGGPGASATALLRKYYYELEDHFTVVYWVQRGTGKSFSKHITKEEITAENYIQDVDWLMNYLKIRFDKEKILLVGHSWGSRPGMYAIQRNPKNFIAYIGIGQELHSFKGELLSYQYTLKKAEEKGHKRAIKELNEMGPPQSGYYKDMYATGFWSGVRQKLWLLKFGGERYQKTNYMDWILAIWFSREYSFTDLIRYGKGSAFSAGNIIFDERFNNMDLFAEISEVDVPVYFISGVYDYNTPWDLVKEYADHLNARYKELILFEKSGHSPVFEEPEKFNSEVIRVYNQIRIK